jgi:hypothetical protein
MDAGIQFLNTRIIEWKRGWVLKIALGSVRGFMVKIDLEFKRKDKIMIKHMVMWKFKDDVVEADKLEMKRQLESLQGVVPSLIHIEIGMDIVGKEASKDMVLTTEFQSMEDLAAYAGHPEHVKVVEFVKPLVCERAVVDYEV